MRIAKFEINQLLVVFLFVMLSYGYIVSTFLPVYLGVDSTPFNIGFRALYLGVSMYLIISGFRRFLNSSRPTFWWVLLSFVLFYCLRLLYDVFVLDIVFKSNIQNLMLFTFGSNFLPFFAVLINGKRVNVALVLRMTYLVTFVSGVLIYILISRLPSGLSLDILIGRVVLRDGNDSQSINPITLSAYGMVLGLLSMYFLLFKKNIKKIIYVVGFLLGLSLLIAGASRGPQVVFVLVLLVLMYKFFFVKRKSLMLKIKSFSLLVFVLIGFGYLISLIDLEKIAMYNRFAHFGEGLESDTSMREQTYYQAFQQFLSSPIYGDLYVVRGSKTYPHNIILETLMATGLIGALLFFSVLFVNLIKKSKNDNQLGVYILFLIPFLSAMFSSSIFFNPELFMSLALMASFKNIKGKSLSL